MINRTADGLNISYIIILQKLVRFVVSNRISLIKKNSKIYSIITHEFIANSFIPQNVRNDSAFQFSDIFESLICVIIYI